MISLAVAFAISASMAVWHFCPCSSTPTTTCLPKNCANFLKIPELFRFFQRKILKIKEISIVVWINKKCFHNLNLIFLFSSVSILLRSDPIPLLYSLPIFLASIWPLRWLLIFENFNNFLFLLFSLFYFMYINFVLFFDQFFPFFFSPAHPLPTGCCACVPISWMWTSAN